MHGAGGHAKMCLDILLATREFACVGLLSTPLPNEDSIYEVPLLGTEERLPEIFDLGVRIAILGVGAVLQHQIRKSLYERLLQIGFDVPTIIHPKAIIEASAKIGRGCQIMAGAIIGSSVTIEDNCIINSGAIIGHDSVIRSHTHNRSWSRPCGKRRDW